MTLFCVPMKSSYSVPSAMMRTMVQAKSKSVFAFERIQAVKYESSKLYKPTNADVFPAVVSLGGEEINSEGLWAQIFAC